MDTEHCDGELVSVSRRGFLTQAGGLVAGSIVAGGLLSASPALAQETTETAPADTTTSDEVKIFDGQALSIGHLLHDPDLCCGCRQCEIVCSLSKWGVVNPELSNIRIRTDILGGYISAAEACKQCPGAECVAICPTDAAHIDPKTGARVIDKAQCVGCGLCVNACPGTPSRVHYIASANIYQKCDLCDGDPKCVAHCPAEALSASWVKKADDGSTVKTACGIVINIALTGAVLSTGNLDVVKVSNVNAVIDPEGTDGVVISGEISSTYSTPFVAKIKASYFDADGKVLFFSERLELDVEPGSTVKFEDVFETTSPENVTRCRLEIMCGKIAG